MSDIIFKSEVKGNTDHGWDVIGHVDSTYLKVDGEYVINPSTGNPYAVPVGYNPQDTIDRFVKFDQKDSVFQNLYQYKTSGGFDLQRGINGEKFGGFVEDYRPIASFDFGLAVSAGGLSVTTGEIGGGAVNLKNAIQTSLARELKITKAEIPNASGDFFNNPANIPNIEKGYSAYKNDSLRLLDILREQLKTDANWLTNQDLSKEIVKIFDGAITSVNDGIHSVTNSDEWETHFNELFPALDKLRHSSTDKQTVDSIKNKVNSAKSTSSPIVLDLNNDGINTTDVKQGAYFDHAGDGFAEQTGWINPNDALLVRDLNNNGYIDDGTELFGNETLISGIKAANGFEALKVLDGNHDNQITTQDADFNSLKLWIDANGDGFSQSNELHTLAEESITAISTNYQNSTFVDNNNNAHKQIGSYTLADGSQAAAEDIWFAVDRTYSLAKTYISVPDDVTTLSNLSGYGVVRDLWQAIALDTSSTLKTLVISYQTETDEGQRHSLINNILYRWANADTVAPQSRGSYVDARQLVTLEHFLGDGFYQFLSNRLGHKSW